MATNTDRTRCIILLSVMGRLLTSMIRNPVVWVERALES
jgi:hypothetical protein